ncbi:hypothetical protein BX600DRAFT_548387 [Xylariales sp. PMI_506]|nr:hypothetical protein BX600DRAFT_548387 [Xylariales sp. PMI_506]
MAPIVWSLDIPNRGGIASAISFVWLSGLDAAGWLRNLGDRCMTWLSQPHVYSALIAWAVTFTLLYTLLLSLGFGPIGIVAGSFAAAFQSYMYGGFTPAGGLFATITSLAMLGTLLPLGALFSAVIATVVATLVWRLQS